MSDDKINALTAALKVMTQTPHIRAYLAVMDPKALEQAETALEVPEFMRGALKGALPDLREMQVVLSALKEVTEVTGLSFPIARALRARMEAGMGPLAEREDKINEEEDRKERRKALMADH